jgi:hypothetical protein
MLTWQLFDGQEELWITVNPVSTMQDLAYDHLPMSNTLFQMKIYKPKFACCFLTFLSSTKQEISLLKLSRASSSVFLNLKSTLHQSSTLLLKAALFLSPNRSYTPSNESTKASFLATRLLNIAT